VTTKSLHFGWSLTGGSIVLEIIKLNFAAIVYFLLAAQSLPFFFLSFLLIPRLVGPTRLVLAFFWRDALIFSRHFFKNPDRTRANVVTKKWKSPGFCVDAQLRLNLNWLRKLHG